mmetsp:Transcript_15996/g.22791  ORF Transcript_15996/g.22791 Transcript_15996/m.22791 type:complete len:229 (+) Transcript_15996:122-808(+)|eukprot:CAMPEP_0184861464 /NCGR_PEP_ID=MMETSP0580-20130426/6150_1 /TAXON_ID=1118495 /ORGANISM="Dactyliosolen fragilissimus" /LENGTH=228 /DNA_ID=CAMNT_0027358979 /DNA_START=101 /DNA_END=787 /DNA_ORIENTATION=+
MTVRVRTCLSSIMLIIGIPFSNAFCHPRTKVIYQNAENMRMSLHQDSQVDDAQTRRDIFKKSVAFISAATVASVNPYIAEAAKAGPTADELNRIKVGYQGIQYLLDNFDKETTVCRENGGECKRDADAVRRFLGLRSTTDPLFQIEKVFDKVKYMDIDPDQLEPFFEATEEWNTAVNMSNSMAFISQFGEYNPGGGKDEVLKYLEESKKQVIIAEKALRTIMTSLDLN